MDIDYSSLSGITPEYEKAVRDAPVDKIDREGGLIDRSLGYLLGAAPTAVSDISKAAGNLFGIDGNLIDQSAEMAPSSTTGGKVVDFFGNLLPIAATFETGAGVVGGLSKAAGLTSKAPVIASGLRQAAGFGLVGQSQSTQTGQDEAAIGGAIGLTHGLPLPARIIAGAGLGFLSKAIFDIRHPEAANGSMGAIVGLGNAAASILTKRIGGARPVIPNTFATGTTETSVERAMRIAAEREAQAAVSTGPIQTAPSNLNIPPVDTPPPAVGYVPSGEMPGVLPESPKLATIAKAAEEVLPATSLQSMPELARPNLVYPNVAPEAFEHPTVGYQPSQPMVGVLPVSPKLETIPIVPKPIEPPPLVESSVQKMQRLAAESDAAPTPPLKTTPSFNPLAIPRLEEAGSVAGIGPNLPASVAAPQLGNSIAPVLTRAVVGGIGGTILAGPDADAQQRILLAGTGAALAAAGPAVIDSITKTKHALKGSMGESIVKSEAGSIPATGGKKMGINPNELTPALRDVDGRIIPGEKFDAHIDIKKRQPEAWRDANALADWEEKGAEHGFLHDGKFLTREEAAAKLGWDIPLRTEELTEMQKAAPALQSLQNVHPTETPEFKEWFGDSKGIYGPEFHPAQVGKPKIFFHGTSKDTDFNTFKIGQRGAFFTDNPNWASGYSMENDSMKSVLTNKVSNGAFVFEKVNTKSRVIPAYLKFEKPYKLTEADLEVYKTQENYAKWQREFHAQKKAEGYDAIDYGGGVISVFNPNQIKSTIGNSGKFSLKTGDIRGSIMPELNSYILRSATGAVAGGLVGGHFDTNGDTSGFVTGALLGAAAFAGGPEIGLSILKKIAKTKEPIPKKGLNWAGNLSNVFAQSVENRAGAVIHGSQLVSDRLVSWLDKAFDTTMPVAVSRTLRVAEGTATNLLDIADNAMRKMSILYKAPEDIRKAANAYLDGGDEAEFLRQLTTDDHKIYGQYVVAARESINGLQRMIASGLGSDPKSKMVIDSIGNYMTRSYKLFTRDSWTPSVDTVNNLTRKLKEDKMWENASEGEIKDHLYSYIREVEATKGMYRGSGTKQGQSIDQTVFKARKDLSDEWRAFLGEITNPVERVAQTMYRLRPISVASKFMHDIATTTKEGDMPVYFRDRGELEAFKAKHLQRLQSVEGADKAEIDLQLSKLDNFIPVERIPKYGEFGGGLVSRDVHNTLSTFDSMTSLGQHPIFRSIAGLNVAAKLSNTALNPISFVRNVFQIPMMMAIGRASMNDVYEGLRILHDPSHPLRQEIISQGIGSADQLKQEIFRDFNTATEGKFMAGMDMSNLSIGGLDADVARKAFGMASNKYLDIYRSPDNAVRIGTYLSAKRRIADNLGKALDDPIVIQKATDFTNRYTMDYGAVAPIIKNVRQIPGINLFISYISEMTRISKNVIEDVIKGGDGLTSHGRMYAALPIAFLGALPEIMNDVAEAGLNPKDRRDWEKVKSLMPAYARTRYRVNIKREADGNFTYTDFTPLIPTDFIHQTVKALGNKDAEAALAVNPVFGLQNSPALNILVEQTTGKDIHTQRDFRGFSDRVASVAKEILPPWVGAGREARKFEQAYTPNEKGELGLTNLRTGQRLTPTDFWLPYATALRSGGYNLSVLEQKYTAEVKRDIANNTAYLNDILKSDAAPQVKLREQEKFAQVYQELIRSWQQKMGITKDQ